MFCVNGDDPDADRHADGTLRSELQNTLQQNENTERRHDLCSICSQNQLLKIKQLANFVPQNEV